MTQSVTQWVMPVFTIYLLTYFLILVSETSQPVTDLVTIYSLTVTLTVLLLATVTDWLTWLSCDW